MPIKKGRRDSPSIAQFSSPQRRGHGVGKSALAGAEPGHWLPLAILRFAQLSKADGPKSG